MGTKIFVGVDADFLGFLEEPGKVIPEVWAVTNSLGNHVTHFVNGYEGDDFFIDKGLVAALSLSEAEMDFFAFIYTVGCVFCVGCGFFEAIGIGLEVAGELDDLGLIWDGGFEVELQLIHLETDLGHGIGCVLFIWHVSDSIGFTVNRTFYRDEWILRV